MNKIKKTVIPFTQVPNKVLYDNNLSLKAKGLYAYMISKPDGWVFHTEAILKEIKEGQSAFFAAIAELKKWGYIKISRERKADGRYGCTIYEFLDVFGVSPHQENTNPDEPYVENLDVVYIDKMSNTEESNTEGTNPPVQLFNCTSPQRWDDTEILSLWNRLAEKWCLPKIREVSDERRKALAKRFKESKCETLYDMFKLLDEALMGSLFLRGEKQRWTGSEWLSEGAGWKADFDFFMQKSSFLKAIEGGYDDKDILEKKEKGMWEQYKVWVDRQRGKF